MLQIERFLSTHTKNIFLKFQLFSMAKIFGPPILGMQTWFSGVRDLLQRFAIHRGTRLWSYYWELEAINLGLASLEPMLRNCLSFFQETFWLARKWPSSSAKFIKRIWVKLCVDSRCYYCSLVPNRIQIVEAKRNLKLSMWGPPKRIYQSWEPKISVHFQRYWQTVTSPKFQTARIDVSKIFWCLINLIYFF